MWVGVTKLADWEDVDLHNDAAGWIIDRGPVSSTGAISAWTNDVG